MIICITENHPIPYPGNNLGPSVLSTALCVSAMKLMTAIVDIAVSVEAAKENARRQYESEKHKHQSKKANDRINALQHKKQEVCVPRWLRDRVL